MTEVIGHRALPVWGMGRARACCAVWLLLLALVRALSYFTYGVWAEVTCCTSSDSFRLTISLSPSGWKRAHCDPWLQRSSFRQCHIRLARSIGCACVYLEALGLLCSLSVFHTLSLRSLRRTRAGCLLCRPGTTSQGPQPPLSDPCFAQPTPAACWTTISLSSRPCSMPTACQLCSGTRTCPSGTSMAGWGGLLKLPRTLCPPCAAAGRCCFGRAARPVYG
jgi:hypothetical protein